MEEYVSKLEFQRLEQDVQEIKESREKDSELLMAIDKKIDIISERIKNADKTDDLKLQQLTSRVSKLEDNHVWVSRTLAGTIISIIIGIIFEVARMVK